VIHLRRFLLSEEKAVLTCCSVKVLGTVYGITVRARNIGADIGAALKSIVGGEIHYFTTLMYTSRNSAVERLVGECLQRGGNAIIAQRFDQGEVSRVFRSRSWEEADYLAGPNVCAGMRLRHSCHCGEDRVEQLTAILNYLGVLRWEEGAGLSRAWKLAGDVT
jgi:uncharacterized protein YbjQ (UPF0145 family)